MADDGSFQERILQTLENIVTRDRELRSFSIVPEEQNTKNKSPILYEDHHIALESWCVKHIYRYAYSDLLEVRRQLRRNRLSSFKANSLNHLLVGVLLINPDVSTFWAMKRELVESDILSIDSELLFSKLVLSYKSKSNETFSYRRWLLKRILNKTNDPEVLRLIYTSEMIVVEIAAEKSANNYHAWTHRIWCTENILSRIPQTVRINMYHHELERSLKWVEQHVSENAGYHYRQYLLTLFKAESQNFYFELHLRDIIKYLGLIHDSDPVVFLKYLLGEPENCFMTAQKNTGWLNYFTFLLHELFFVIPKLNVIFPDHESLWYHRRFLVHHLVEGFYEYHNIERSRAGATNVSVNHNIPNNNIVNVDISCLGNTGVSDYGEKQPKIFKSQPVEIESSRLYELLTRCEQKFISDNLTNQSLQREYAGRHAKWLKLILGFHNI